MIDTSMTSFRSIPVKSLRMHDPPGFTEQFPCRQAKRAVPLDLVTRYKTKIFVTPALLFYDACVQPNLVDLTFPSVMKRGLNESNNKLEVKKLSV